MKYVQLLSFLTILIGSLSNTISGQSSNNSSLSALEAPSISESSVKRLDSAWYERNYGDSANLFLSQRRLRLYRWDDKIDKELFFYRNISDTNWDEHKVEYQYNSGGGLNISITYLKDSVRNTWIPNYKREWKTDSVGISIEADYKWDQTGSKWSGDIKMETVRNNDRQVIRETTFRWLNAAWTKDRTKEFSYYNDSLVSNVINLDWNIANQAWLPSYKVKYTYDANINALLQYTQYVWDWGWAAYSKTDYYKGLNTKDTLVIYYSYDGISEWNPIRKERMKYDSNGFISFHEHSLYDSLSWTIGFRRENINSPNGRIVEQISFRSLIELDSIVKDWKTVFQYSSNFEVLLGQESSTWDTLTSSWKLHSKKDYKYDSDSDMQSERYYLWNDTITSWDLIHKQTYYYHNGIGLKEYAQTEPYIFPSPASNVIHFNLPEKIDASLQLHIYHLNGSEVISRNIKPTLVINVSSIPNGLYIFKINGFKRNYEGKLLIQH